MSKIKVLVNCVPAGNPLLGPDSSLLSVSSHVMGRDIEGGEKEEEEEGGRERRMRERKSVDVTPGEQEHSQEAVKSFI